MRGKRPRRTRTRLVTLCLLILGLCFPVQAQEVVLTLTVSDGAASATLRVGLDPAASDGLDQAVGEDELPPLPPSPSFDARLVDFDLNRGGLGEGSRNDFVEGDSTCNCSRVYELRFQTGADDQVQILWSFPSGVVGTLSDLFGGVAFEKTLVDSGAVDVSASLEKLLLTVDYRHLINDRPVFTSVPVLTARQNDTYAYSVEASDLDGDSLRFYSVPPGWLVLTDNGDNTAVLEGTPTNNDVGLHSVTVEVNDGELTEEQHFSIVVENVNDPPAFVDGDEVLLTAVEDSLFLFTALASDPDGDLLDFVIAPPLSPWITASNNGDNSFTLSGTPLEEDLGPSAAYSLVASDSNERDTLRITIDYRQVNDAPSRPTIINPPDQTELLLAGDPLKVVTVEWSDVVDTDGPMDSVSFVWSAALAEDFAGGALIEKETFQQFVQFTQRELVTLVDGVGVKPDEGVRIWHRVAAFDGELYSLSDAVSVRLVRGAITGVDSAGPSTFAVFPAYPNPTGNDTSVRYDLPDMSPVRIHVYDVLGRLVRDEGRSMVPAGRHVATIAVRDLAPGVYVFMLEAGSRSSVQRLVVAR